VQIRRVLLLFALVLGLSALVASIAPPPETRDEAAEDTTVATSPAPPAMVMNPARVEFSARAAGGPPETRRVRVGSSFVMEVSVPKPGDVVVYGLGLRQSADELTPARFAVLAEPRGRYPVNFVPVDGEPRVVGRLAFVEPATVTPRRPDR
jgi:hypothetical protein